MEIGRDHYLNAFVCIQIVTFLLFSKSLPISSFFFLRFIKAIQCPPPVVPLNGHLIQSESAGMDGGRYAVGSLVQFACRGAHLLEGEASIICTETGYWSHPPPFCK